MRTITREQAVAELRRTLMGMVDQQNSLCRVAAWRKIFCRGFSQWTQSELEQRFPGIPRGAGELERGHQELLANRAQLRRQDIHAGKLPCDLEPEERARSGCAGWDEFDDADLARFHREVCGEDVWIARAPQP